jgi:hypothetical protein
MGHMCAASDSLSPEGSSAQIDAAANREAS